jgi:hypothetical protein
MFASFTLPIVGERSPDGSCAIQGLVAPIIPMFDYRVTASVYVGLSRFLKISKDNLTPIIMPTPMDNGNAHAHKNGLSVKANIKAVKPVAKK